MEKEKTIKLEELKKILKGMRYESKEEIEGEYDAYDGGYDGAIDLIEETLGLENTGASYGEEIDRRLRMADSGKDGVCPSCGEDKEVVMVGGRYHCKRCRTKWNIPNDPNNEDKIAEEKKKWKKKK